MGQPQQAAVQPDGGAARGRAGRRAVRLAVRVHGGEVAVVAQGNDRVPDRRVGAATGPAGRRESHPDQAGEAVGEHEQPAAAVVYPGDLRIRPEPAGLVVQVSHDPVDGGQRRAEAAGGQTATRAVVPMTGRSATATVSSPVFARSQDPAGAGAVVVLMPGPWSVVMAAAVADRLDRLLAGHRVGGGDRRHPGRARGRHGVGHRGRRLAGRHACRRPGHPGSAGGRDRVGGRGGTMAGRGPGRGGPAVRCPGPCGRGGRRRRPPGRWPGRPPGLRPGPARPRPRPSRRSARPRTSSTSAGRGRCRPAVHRAARTQSLLSQSPESSRRSCPDPPRPGSGTRPAG